MLMLSCYFEVNIKKNFIKLPDILKRSHDYFLYTKKKTSRVLFYNKIQMLPRI